jgi:hypothetical protein
MVRVSGKVNKGRLAVPARIALPDGDVLVTVATAHAQAGGRNGLSYEELISHPAFGILKRYKEMANSAEYVANLRKREDERSKRAR